MKELVDGNKVPSRTYYYLLEWNEKDNKKYLWETFGEMRLCDLNIVQYIQLFKHATKVDLEMLS